MCGLMFFNLLYLNWMECPKIILGKEKRGGSCLREQNLTIFCVFGQNVNFSTTIGQKTINLALSVKF